MNIEEKYLEKIWARINNGDDDRLMLSWDEQFDITDILKEYHAEQLALCNVSNWVACKDKLPLYYDSYLVVWQNDVLQLFFDEKEKIWHTNEMEEYKNVTHWMELPEPPCY